MSRNEEHRWSGRRDSLFLDRTHEVRTVEKQRWQLKGFPLVMSVTSSQPFDGILKQGAVPALFEDFVESFILGWMERDSTRFSSEERRT